MATDDNRWNSVETNLISATQDVLPNFSLLFTDLMPNAHVIFYTFSSKQIYTEYREHTCIVYKIHKPCIISYTNSVKHRQTDRNYAEDMCI